MYICMYQALKHLRVATTAHRPKPASVHVEHVIVTGAVLAALLRHHHELMFFSLEEKPVLRIQAVHARALCGQGISSVGHQETGQRTSSFKRCCWQQKLPLAATYGKGQQHIVAECGS